MKKKGRERGEINLMEVKIGNRQVMCMQEPEEEDDRSKG